MAKARLMSRPEDFKKLDVPVFESNLLHIKPFSIQINNLAFQEFAFTHYSIWLLSSLEDNDGCSHDNS